MHISSAKFIKSATDIKQCPPETLPEYAFLGRSNVGKSSLINMLTSTRNMAKTSSTPGKTQLINHFLINDSWYIVDLPGYGYARAAKTQRTIWNEFIHQYLTKRENMVNLFLLIDSRHPLQKIDAEAIEFLGENQVPFSLVFTKIDKLKKTEIFRNIENIKKELHKTWEELPMMFLSSSETRLGRDSILDYIEELNKTQKF